MKYTALLAVLLGVLTYQHPLAFAVTVLVMAIVLVCNYLETKIE